MFTFIIFPFSLLNLFHCHFLVLMFKHPFHLVTPSPWPIITRISLLVFISGFLIFLGSGTPSCLIIGFICLFLCSCSWLSNIIVEGRLLGCHTLTVRHSLRLGFLLFLLSEVFLFFAFFWAYLHSSLSPSVELSSAWPPVGITPIPCSAIPLLNTFILLFSGLLLTWSHSCLLSYDYLTSISLLGLAVSIGFVFRILQLHEYHSASFCISDSVYGSCFYIATGLHGLHVLFGSIFLVVSGVRLFLGHFTPTNHLGFYFSAWYWHFVDVIWLLLFAIMYCWGS